MEGEYFFFPERKKDVLVTEILGVGKKGDHKTRQKKRRKQEE